MTTGDPDGGNDDRRAMPPADPWLAAAPTSPIEHVGVVDDTLRFDGHRPPRRGRWFAAAAVVALLACLGGALLSPFDDDDGTTGRSGPTTVRTAAGTAPRPAGSAAAPAALRASTSASASAAVPSTPRPSAEAGPAGEVVVYLVSSGRRGEVARVEFIDRDGEIIRRGEVTLPWRHTFRVLDDRSALVVNAQRKRGGTGPLTCSISRGGKVLTSVVQRGRSAAPMCTA